MLHILINQTQNSISHFFLRTFSQQPNSTKTQNRETHSAQLHSETGEHEAHKSSCRQSSEQPKTASFCSPRPSLTRQQI